MKRFRLFDTNLFQHFFEEDDFIFTQPEFTRIRAGRFYDPEKYDLVPKPETTKRLIKEKEAELERLRKLKENDIKSYESREKTLSLELDQLCQKQLKP